MNEDQRKTIDTLKILGIDMINVAQSGHPGIVLGAAPIMYTLFANHLNFKSDNPKWFNRDRFVMSAGHGSALLYATLYLAGFNIPKEELEKFRQLDSILPGHPELGLTPGVEVSTGPLGQGIASAIGMALAQRYLKAMLEEDYPKQDVINHNIYCLCGDGDLMEGIAYEACSFAGMQKLDKLIILYDSNNVTLDGEINLSFKENVLKRFEAMGWFTQYVKDGTNIKELDKAIEKAKKSNLPSIIEIKTIIGFGSANAGKNIVHGKPLDDADLDNLRSSASVKELPFSVSKDVVVHFQGAIKMRMDPIYNKWQTDFMNLKTMGNEYAKRIASFFDVEALTFDFQVEDLKVSDDYIDELRNGNNKIMNIISDKTPFFLGGSADLSSSCKTNLNNSGIMSIENQAQKNIYFGIREHAMGAILNGMATYGLRVFGSTFLTFSDYLKPAIRMSSLMDLPVTYIFTHDSVAIGEDGATHQPVEQLASLRTIPNLFVYRPADIREIMGSWSTILKDRSPSVLVISKQKSPVLKNSQAALVSKGAYIIKSETTKLDGIVMATGTDVYTAITIANELETEGISLRVLSVPNLKLFDTGDNQYKANLLPENIPVITLEASNDPSWYKYATSQNHVLNIDDFGYSGKPIEILQKLEFTNDMLKNKIRILISKGR